MYSTNEYHDFIEKKQETIDGKIFYMSPARSEHSVVIMNLYDMINPFLKEKGCRAFPDNMYVIFDEENKFIPDLTVFCDKTKLTHRGYEAVPLLLVEVLSPSTFKNDKLYKYKVYEKYGVGEYWIIDIERNFIEQYIYIENDKKFVLKDIHGKFGDMDTSDDIFFHSEVFPDLRIDYKRVFES